MFFYSYICKQMAEDDNRNPQASLCHSSRCYKESPGKNEKPSTVKRKPVKPLPSGDKLRKLAPIYIKRWDNLQDYPEQERTLNRLFAAHPGNTDFDTVMVKVATLDNFYSTQLRSVPEVVYRILSIGDFDGKVSRGDRDLVDMMCATDAYKPFSFASKYCSRHNKDAYPIYDSFVANVLSKYREDERFTTIGTDILDNRNKSYEKDYFPIMTDFMMSYGLTRHSFKEIDIFLWLLGKECFSDKYKPLLYKSARIGDFSINIEMSGSVLVYDKSELFNNTLEGIREAARLLNGFHLNPKWNTRQAGSEMVRFAVEHPECMP